MITIMRGGGGEQGMAVYQGIEHHVGQVFDHMW